ncbi:CoA transferase [Pseudoroseomonas wenyumeiae]|uniref:CoA transferase n=1 Tax=Teichococcus wenyumeiae TaxID=2478470 RepID=A0A3A9JF49_9PROT|nr:CaiB/BaiF CoA-transferase family protein [Pseudoroseomonas wenyumeiae]RKK05957.1 CoA transferase [Pseudoroseomonas wenyumeiae]RMI19820.1 CoA transferase [Pseudoroseomonas wenyumeiae]
MKPLDGLVILDLSRVLACPFATMLLAEMGAEVIKVEQPGSGDETRSFEPFAEAPGGSVSGYYMACNRSKSSITVNLRHEEGRRVIRDLAAQADVLVENFPVGTLARRGLDYAELAEVNPRLVYLSCTGFGQTGPYAKRKGYDTVFQAMGGLMGLTGERGGGPVKPGLPVADLSSGLWAAIAILTALRGRDRTGKGGHVDLSMFDAQVALLTIAAARNFALGEVPPRLGTEHPGRVPSASFRCADDRYLHITASDQHWAPLCAALELDDLATDAELSTNAGRVARREEVMAAMSRALAALPRGEAFARLDGAGVPAGPVLALDEVLVDEHVQARGMVSRFDHPVLGQFPALPVPLRFEGWANPEVGRPPLLGEHTEEVLARRLGMDAARVAELREMGAL